MLSWILNEPVAFLYGGESNLAAPDHAFEAVRAAYAGRISILDALTVAFKQTRTWNVEALSRLRLSSIFPPSDTGEIAHRMDANETHTMRKDNLR